MNWFWSALVLALAACRSPAPANEVSLVTRPTQVFTSLRSERVIESVRSALDEVGAYEARLTSRVDSAALFGQEDALTNVAETHLRVRPPSQVSVSLRLTTDHPAMAERESRPINVLFDGETIWSGSVRLDQGRLAHSPQPLDSRFQLRGAGILARKDLVETIRAFLDRYTFEPSATLERVEGVEVTLLVGEMSAREGVDLLMRDADQVAGLVQASATELGPRFIEMSANGIATLLRVSLFINRETALPHSWVMGTEGASLSTTVEEFRTQVTFDETTFAVPEAQVDAVDQTEAYLAQLAQVPTPSSDQVNELRAALIAAVERIIAQRSEPEEAEPAEELETTLP